MYQKVVTLNKYVYIRIHIYMSQDFTYRVSVPLEKHRDPRVDLGLMMQIPEGVTFVESKARKDLGLPDIDNDNVLRWKIPGTLKGGGVDFRIKMVSSECAQALPLTSSLINWDTEAIIRDFPTKQPVRGGAWGPLYSLMTD
jgi:hypothetical protein